MSYNYYSDDSVSKLLGFMFSTVWFMIMLVIFAFTILISWKIFEKFGEPGWKSLIPIYNIYIMFKYIFGSGLWIIALMVPILNFIVAIMFAAKIFPPVYISSDNSIWWQQVYTFRYGYFLNTLQQIYSLNNSYFFKYPTYVGCFLFFDRR